ncbi:hypothetical protein [Deinococcus peraridilitoris]|uniref:Transcriptional regulator n=1 Tax=Deinococcus peraridilitoris (strain DSM 19664 / LMG 22246 / CIP 109416 / KR-200) TaxID=937777 RepID=L0A295_DEIPD|nr:hypothetical protein [Deinococcus peraridilitoris]AFZ67100.1 hypothetical protein Deipe_1559 [Deinococcus peraridilitoris DSM 19664]
MIVAPHSVQAELLLIANGDAASVTTLAWRILERQHRVVSDGAVRLAAESLTARGLLQVEEHQRFRFYLATLEGEAEADLVFEARKRERKASRREASHA